MVKTSRRFTNIIGISGAALLAATAMLPPAALALPATSGSLWFYSPSHRNPFASTDHQSPATSAMIGAPLPMRHGRGSH